MEKKKAPRNRTMSLSKTELKDLGNSLLKIKSGVSIEDLTNKTINQNLFKCLNILPHNFVDLLFIDPPYNLTKVFNSNTFKKTKEDEYEEWLDSWFKQLLPILKPNASVYVCCDWVCSNSIYNILKKYLIIRNRITWEREKGRGAMHNWKNCSEDIWFATVSDDYYFNPEAVKLKKRVIAPYKNAAGDPKDWNDEEDGKYRLTYPSNLWNDISIPFWSMPENTDHPTQKPEKLVAKIILASSKEGDFVFDPFLGSGTTSVVAKKLGRNYCGIEQDKTFASLCEKRLQIADNDKEIQGYSNGVFWERNSQISKIK